MRVQGYFYFDMPTGWDFAGKTAGASYAPKYCNSWNYQ